MRRRAARPVLIPLRNNCQDANRPAGVDGSAGFRVPTLRGIWDTFPLLLSGSAGLGAVGPEPAFGAVHAGLERLLHAAAEPAQPGGNRSAGAAPGGHAPRTRCAPCSPPPLAVPGTGHGAALGLTRERAGRLIAYLRSL